MTTGGRGTTAAPNRTRRMMTSRGTAAKRPNAEDANRTVAEGLHTKAASAVKAKKPNTEAINGGTTHAPCCRPPRHPRSGNYTGDAFPPKHPVANTRRKSRPTQNGRTGSQPVRPQVINRCLMPIAGAGSGQTSRAATKGVATTADAPRCRAACRCAPDDGRSHIRRRARRQRSSSPARFPPRARQTRACCCCCAGG